MAFEQIPILTALIGSAVAAAYDLKTTEIPHQIFYIMLAIGIAFYSIQASLAQNIWIILNPAIIGSILFAFGFFMYKAGQWGGADGILLAIVVFLIPEFPAGFPGEIIYPFAFTYLLNVFLIGFPYMLAYAIVIAVLNRKVVQSFVKDMKASARLIAIFAIVLFFLFIFSSYFISSQFNISINYQNLIRGSLITIFATVILFTIFKFAKNVEDVAFKRKIPISHLKVGDVLLESKEFEGITEQQYKKIKRLRKKFIWIKDGVRFAPSFPLALLFTLYFGDAIKFLFSIVFALS